MANKINKYKFYYLTLFNTLFAYSLIMKKSKTEIKKIIEKCSGLCILYVEDNDMVRNKNISMFKNIFNSLISCTNGIEALKLYKKSIEENKTYDIVITDINMPEMNGLELSKAIMAINSNQKILAISADNDSDKLESIIDIGVTNYMHKPITIDRLFDVIHRTIIQIKEEKEQENKIIEMKKSVNRDCSTGIKDRKALHCDIKKITTKNLILISISNLNVVQTIYGLDESDKLLQEFVNTLIGIFDGNNNFYRKSTNKFAYLVEKDLDIILLINKINNVLIKSVFDVIIGASSKSDSLIITANMALDFATEHGLKYKVYNSEIDITQKHQNRIFFKTIISNAINEDNVFPVFQPIYDKDKNILKYEVLMRITSLDDTSNSMEHIYYPNQFMQIAHESNKFIELSIITIKKAFQKMQYSDKQFSINVSYDDIINEYLIDLIEDQILQYENVGNRLVLEILETKDITDYQQVEKFIERFKKYGVKIALDDFGSGYSNLNHIISFHCDYVKLDGALIKNIKEDTKSLAIVRSVISFTKELGIKVIAEYVANKEIFEITKKLGIDEFQGFYLSKPLRNIL